MLFDVQLPVYVLHADIMYVQVVTRGYAADPIEQALTATGTRRRVHHHVCLGEQTTNCRCRVIRYLFGLLEGDVSRHCDRNVGEVPASSTANAHSVNSQNAVHARNCADDSR